MKQNYILKLLFFVGIFGVLGTANAQVTPLAFGSRTLSGGLVTNNNWYADYVGARIVVTAPPSIAGTVNCVLATIGTGTQDWPDIVWTSIVNQPIVMDATCDSFGGTAFAPGSFTGKIAVIWRGPIAVSGACYAGTTYDFGLKAKNAQDAGAIAVVFINEYAGEGPSSPGYTPHGTPIHIPVLMIGNTDGKNIASTYHSVAPGTIKMTITPWGLGNANDIGIINNGQALWHNYAIPAGQLAAGNTQAPYKALDGAFIANFGSNTANVVKLKTTLSFTPTGGSSTVQHTDSIIDELPFAPIDSILAMFDSSSSFEYNLTSTVPGRYDLSYALSSDSIDQNPTDNSVTSSFYLTDSLFSKGRYDFANNKPIYGSYEGVAGASGAAAPEFAWGNYYYIAQGGNSLGKVQYSIENGSKTGSFGSSNSNDIFVFSWVDGSGATAADSIVEDDELSLVSWTTHDLSGDTSSGTMVQSYFNDPTNTTPTIIPLNANTWYFVAIDVPQISGDTLFLGIDGQTDPYARLFGRWWDHGERYFDYSNTVGTSAGFTGGGNLAEFPLSFPQVNTIGAVDSIPWTEEPGLIPAVALITTTHPTLPPVDHTGIQNQTKTIGEISLYPNPATDHVTVSVALAQTANSITYKVIDALGRIVSTEKHSNVLNETYTLSTATMRSGSYYMLITADGQHAMRKFTVVK